MANVNDLFNLSILDSEINEGTEFDSGNIDEFIEATRYDLEFEKALNNYKTLWNSFKKYKEKLSKLHSDGDHSDKYHDKVYTIISGKKKELKDAHDNLIKTYGETIVTDYNRVGPLKKFLAYASDDPNDIITKQTNRGHYDFDNVEAGRDIKREEFRANLHGRASGDGSREPGSYNMKESTDEFADKDPATNHPEAEFDSDATSAKETSIPVPSKVVLSQDTYNDALANLKKSFKEGYEIMGMLEKAAVIPKSIEGRQQEFIENAIYEAMISGPMFEAVDRMDKKLIKSIIKDLRDKVYKFATSDKVVFYKPAVFLRTLFNATGDNSFYTMYLWQVLGGIVLESGNIQSYVKKLNEEFAEELGDYKILAIRVDQTIVDLFRSASYGKSMRKAFFLVIDRKLTSEIKDAVANMCKAAANDSDKNNDNNKKTKKNETLTECVYDFDYEE